MDFTISTYKRLIRTLLRQGFSFQTFADFILKPEDKTIVLRHDVDLLPDNSLVFARIQADMGIKGTYYFRIVRESWNEKIIRKIAEMGHEVGYHYEDVSLIAERQKSKRSEDPASAGTKVKSRSVAKIPLRRGQKDEENNNITSQRHNAITKKEVGIKKYEEEEYKRYLASLAIVSFKENLERIRQIVPVKTICMHGSPLSRWDSRVLWKYYDYRDFGIIGEPYFDVDFDEVLYLTDTGRRWDGDSVNIRDKSFNRKERKVIAKDAKTSHPAPFPKFHSTFDIINAAKEGRLPDKIMITFHPQRWTDKPLPWVKELVWQNVKNAGKFFVVKFR